MRMPADPCAEVDQQPGCAIHRGPGGQGSVIFRADAEVLSRGRYLALREQLPRASKCGALHAARCTILAGRRSDTNWTVTTARNRPDEPALPNGALDFRRVAGHERRADGPAA